MKLFKLLTFFFLIISSLVSCGKLPTPSQAIPLYKDQLHLMNGYYEINPYESAYSFEGIPLDEVFDMEIPQQVNFIQLEFIDKKTLQISYEHAGETYIKQIKGKHKQGGFYLHKTWGALGVPPLVWLQWNNGKRIFMGNDDNLIFDISKNESALIFGFNNQTIEREIIFYDRLYEKFYTGKPKTTLID